MAKKILLADDSITIQKVVELTFSDGDYQIISASNGAKAIQKLSEFRPDIILSDIIMPEKNGYEVCEYVKSHPDFRSIPVILLTGTFEPFDPDRAEKAGCDAIVTKPFESQSLIQKVDELIRASEEKNRQSGASPDTVERFGSAAAPAESSPAAVAETPEPFSSPAGFSPPKLQRTDQSARVESEEAVFPQSDDSALSVSPSDATMPWQIPSFENEPHDDNASALTSSRDEDSPFAAGGWRSEPSETSPADTSPPPGLELASPESIDVHAQSNIATTSFDNESASSESQVESEPRWQLETPDAASAEEPFAGTEGSNFGSEASSSNGLESADREAQQWGPAAVADESPAPPEEEADDISGGRTLPFPRFGNVWQEREEEAPTTSTAESRSDEPSVENAASPTQGADPWTAETTQWPTESASAAKSSEPAEPEAAEPMRGADEATAEPVPFPVPATFSSAETIASDESGWALSTPSAADSVSASAEEAAVQSAPSMDMFSPAEESAPAPAKTGGSDRMSEDDVERIARRVVQLISEDLIRNIAWEVVPEMAEMVVRDRIRQLESED